VIQEPDLGNGVIDMPLSAAANSFDNDNAVRGYIQSWNLTLEKRLGNWITSAGYVATRSVNQLASMNQNWSPIGGGNNGRLMVQRFGRPANTSLFGSLGTNKYDSLQMRAERRFAGDYQLSFGYTWGHSRGFINEDSAGGLRGVAIPWLYDLNYGRTGQDIRHNFQVTGIFELPFGRGKRWAQDGFLSHLLGGWQFNTLMSLYSGQPFTVTASGAELNAPGSTQRADCLTKPTNLGDINQWYDVSAFAPVQEARFGSCGTNSLGGPGLFNMDVGVFRRFQLSERFDLQFRMEMFNMSNTPHHSNPQGNVNNSAFMQAFGIRNTGREGIDERTFRFGLRLGF
jgi:hypothetical protein